MLYIIENDVSGDFQSCDGVRFKVDRNGAFEFGIHLYGEGETYEVELEEEITEDTEFEQVLINAGSHLHIRLNYSIKRANHTFYGVQEIFARIDEKLQKIWERE